MSKVSVIAKLEVKPGMGDKFIDQWNIFLTHVSENQPDTEHYVLHRLNNAPDTFYVTEIYKNKAALDAHSTSDAMVQFFGKIKDYVKESDIHFLTPVKTVRI